MAAIVKRSNTSNSIFRFGRTANVLSLVLLALFVCVGCSQHYCPTYASMTYNKSFSYSAEKYLTYKPVKVHEFKTLKVNKSDKKEKNKTKVR